MPSDKFKYDAPKHSSGGVFAWAVPKNFKGTTSAFACKLFGKVILHTNGEFTLRGYRVPRKTWDRNKVFKGPVEIRGSLANWTLYWKD